MDRIEEAQDAGYEVTVVFCDVPVEVCLYRNRVRALDEEMAANPKMRFYPTKDRRGNKKRKVDLIGQA